MKRDKVFLTLISLVLVTLFIGIFIRGKKEVSIIENRALKYFPKFSVDKFIDTSFQSDVEDAFVDQILLGEDIKAKYKSLKLNSLNAVVSLLNGININSKQYAGSQVPERKDKNHTEPKNLEFKLDIIPKGEDIYQLKDTDHLVVKRRDQKISREKFSKKAENYNKLVKKYPDLSYNLYYIESAEDVDFIDGKIDHSLIDIFFSFLDPKINKSALYINHPLDYEEMFYKTDHHWTTTGQIEGYRGIIRNLKGNDEKLLDINSVPIEDVKYNGYFSRKASVYDIYDEFELSVADLPKHKVYVNDVEAPYGRKQDYIDGNFIKEKGFGYYGDANGDDFGVVHYDFNKPKEQNLLVFIDSFSNPLKQLIASHYNNTYYVDFRYYEDAYGKKFDFGDFIKQNDIDQVLFMGYYISFTSEDFLITD